MQIIIDTTIDTPFQLSRTAALLDDLAVNALKVAPQPVVLNEPEQATAKPETEPAAKKTRSKKETAPAVVAEPEPTPEPAPKEVPVEPEGNESATTAEPATESGSEETAAPVTIDDLRILFGELSQNGKREDAVKLVRSFGFNSIRDISPDKMGEIYGKLKAL